MATKTTKLESRLARLASVGRPQYWLKAPTSSVSMTLSRSGEKTGYEYEIEVEVTGSVQPFVRGRTQGDPDDCYPDEGGFAEDIEAYYYRDGKGWVVIELTSDESDQANDLLMESAGGSDDRDYDEDRDYDYDNSRYGDYGPDIYDF